MADKQGALEYRGEIGTIRELFALRQIHGLPELPPVPSDCPLLAPIFAGEIALRDRDRTYAAACAVGPELAEHVYLCANRRSPYSPADNGYLSSTCDYDTYRARIEVASRRERQYALLALSFFDEPFSSSQLRAAEKRLKELLN